MRKNISMPVLLLVLFVWSSPQLYALAGFAATETGIPQEKEHQVKVVVIKNGKVTEKDTTFADYGKGITFKGDSIRITESGNGAEKKSMKTIYIRGDDHHDGKVTKTYTYTVTSGDTLQSDIQRKVDRLGEEKKLIIMQESKGENFNQETSPPNAAIWVEGRRMNDPFTFDSSDPDIISYKRKDIGKGQEKITIVRKKAVKP